MAESVLMSFLNERTPPQIKQRGRDYVARERVGRVQHAGAVFFAPVKGVGGAVYTAEIEMGTPKTPEILLSCTCPYFEQFGICKHVYALGLTLERLGDSAGPVERSWREFLSPRRMPKALPAAKRAKVPVPVGETERMVLHYVLDPAGIQRDGTVRVAVMEELVLKSGRVKLGPVPVVQSFLGRVEPEELLRLARLQSLMLEQSHYSYYSMQSSAVNLPAEHGVAVLEDLAATGRLHFGDPERVRTVAELEGVRSELGRVWRVTLRAERAAEGGLALMAGLRCGEAWRDLEAVRFVSADGIAGVGNALTRVENPEWMVWARELAAEGVRVPEDEVADFVESLYERDTGLGAVLPEEIAFREVREAPRCLLRILELSERMDAWMTVEFAYGGRVFDWLEVTERWVVPAAREVHVRDRAAEGGALERLEALGASVAAGTARGMFGVKGPALGGLLEALGAEGWELHIRDARVRTGGSVSLRVESRGQDWFELDGELRFGEEALDLPEVLRSMKRTQRFVRLKSGEVAMLSEGMLERLSVLQGMAERKGEEGALVFSGAGGVFLDLLLAELPGVHWGKEALVLRERLRKLGAPEAAEPPTGFSGTLRRYQQEGLGWMRYLRDAGLNGCLADDMGLGKTVQVLALLEEQRERGAGVSLAVLPRSIVFNWRREAERFAPKLRVAELSGTDRPKSVEDLPEADLYLITYQTLIRDVRWLRDKVFDYVILDESQAVKNPAAKTTKAVRLLQSRHRLTLTGTPVENRIEDLWSQLNFLNPGMLGRKFTEAKTLSEGSLELIARGVRPFLLRRTKEQVATDLPDKVEETLFCELPAAQRKVYEELRGYYQQALAQGISEQGFQKAKIMVLEALLRLRQAACHPGLISEAHAGMESGKLAMLDELLEDILSSGHKALIFSQFTSMLALVRARLDRQKIAYVYLDGQTRDRDGAVRRFQDSPEIPLFLISLKAGGVGLNLTAADYVILLDPWWNPAIEAQAIDRAHRIGQEKRVFAYRVVARDTIEEKILALQEDKRNLAASILKQENSLLSKLTPEDLRFLLG